MVDTRGDGHRPPQETARPGRGRSIAAVLCVVLAALLTAPAAVAYWGQRTLNDTQRYVDTVGPLVESPEVQDVIATKVTDAIQQQVDVEQLLTDALARVDTDRPELERLAGPLAAAINAAIDRQVREFLASDAFADLWTRANTRAHQAFLRILEGDTSAAVSLQGDEIVLDVSEVIDQVKQRLVDRGLTFVENVPVPDVDRQIVLMEAPQVQQLRTIYAFANPVAKWLLPLVGLLYLMAYLLARRKARMTIAIGAAIAANALLIALAISIGRQLFTNELSGTAFGPASRVFYETMLSYLERGQQVVLWLGLVLVAAGWFAGPSRSGVVVRGAVRGGLERAGAALVTDDVRGTAQRAAAQAGWLRACVVVLGAVVLLWGNDVSLTRWWWSFGLVVFLLAVIQVVVGAGRPAETPVAPSVPQEPVGSLRS